MHLKVVQLTKKKTRKILERKGKKEGILEGNQKGRRKRRDENEEKNQCSLKEPVNSSCYFWSFSIIEWHSRKYDCTVLGAPLQRIHFGHGKTPFSVWINFSLRLKHIDHSIIVEFLLLI